MIRINPPTLAEPHLAHYNEYRNASLLSVTTHRYWWYNPDRSELAVERNARAHYNGWQTRQRFRKCSCIAWRSEYSGCSFNWQAVPCCNLSVDVALNVRFTTNGMCAKNNNVIYLARTSNNRVIMACDLYCCLLPQCEALRTCRSGFPIATPWYSSFDNAVHIARCFSLLRYFHMAAQRRYSTEFSKVCFTGA